MNRKIIGVTVGSSLPKPNFKQTDPTKGDYIKNKPDFEGLENTVSDISKLVGDTPVSDQISQYINENGNKIYKQNEEPIDVPDGSLWVDMDADGLSSSGNGNTNGSFDISVDAVLYTKQNLTEEQQEQARENIGVEDALMGTTDDLTPAQVAEAVMAGRNVLLGHNDPTFGLIYFTGFVLAPNMNVVVASGVQTYYGEGKPLAMRFSLDGGISSGNWHLILSQLADITDIPTTLTGSTSEITPSQVSEALLQGRNIVLAHTDSTYGVIYFSGFLDVPALDAVAASGVQIYYGSGVPVPMRFSLAGDKSSGSWGFFYGQLADYSDIPTALIGSTSDITPAQVSEALQEGRNVVLAYPLEGESIIFSGFAAVPTLGTVMSSMVSSYEMGGCSAATLIGDASSGEWYVLANEIATTNDIPERLPNPNKLYFTGAVTGTYDGSSSVTINIPTVSSDGSGETIPEYVRTEAESVARVINQHQSTDSIVFPFLTDAHCGYYLDKNNDAVALAGQLLNLIGMRVPYDFIVNGGDVSSGAWDTTREKTYEHYEDYTELTAEAHKGVPSIWVPGNHDDAPYMATADRLTQKDTFALLGRKNRISGAVCPNGCNYGYLDLENRKLRVIYLDTDDKRIWGTVQVGAGEATDYLNSHNIGGEQLQWLVNTALNFTDKTNPTEWNIVIVSHVVLNISGTVTDAVSGTTYAHSTANAATILNAYRTGKSGSIIHNDITVTYDFSVEEKKATVICAVHGHDHKFCTETLTGSILSIGCPNVMNGRERVSDDGNTYTKTAGTADGTSFCILTIDRENCMIYADCVGVGYNREFTYMTEAVPYTNQIPISTDTDGSVYGYKSGYRLSSSGTLSGESASYITGFIPCKVGDVVRMKNVTFQYGVSSGLTSSNQRVAFYDANKTHLTQTNASGLSGVANGIKGDDNIWTQFTPKATMNSIDCSAMAYFRINASYIGDDSIITVNEEII